MFFILIGAVVTLALSIILKGRKKVLAAAGLLICLLGCTVQIPTGYTGVITVFGRVQDRTLEAGLHVIPPWYSIVKMDNRTQYASLTTQAFSSDIQQVDISMSVNYCIDKETAQELYKSVGRDYYQSVVYPRVLDITKACFSQYSAESLVSNRSTLTDAITSSLAKDMARYGVQIVAVSIEDIDFTDSFTDAVEAKQVAEQEKLKAAIEQEQLTLEAQAAAERAILEAQSALEVAKLEAEANEVLSASFSQTLLKYYAIQAWNGELPTVTSDGALPILGDILQND